VFKAGEELIKNIQISNPLAVLELFANELGYEIEIGDQKSKFIHDGVMKIPNYDPKEEITNVVFQNVAIIDDGSKIKEGFLGDLLANPKDIGGTLRVDIALAYFISIKKYTEYLTSNNLM
jgi:hypothetical protein